MTRLRAALDATVGRRLLVRIWVHGVLLFTGVVATIFAAPYLLPDHHAALTAHIHPRFSLGLAARALALRGDRAALAAELRAIHDESSLELTVYGADDTLLASSDPRALSPATREERRALSPSPGHVAQGKRFVVGAFDTGAGGAAGAGDALEAYAVAQLPAPPSRPLHLLGMLAIALVLALVFVALPLSRSIARPLEQLGATARALGAGRLSVRAPTERRDEIGDLARSFNRMAEQIQQLRLAERELLGDVSHELRTPLARMRVVLDLASDADAERVRRYVREIATDLSELEQLIDDIIASSRLDLDAHWANRRPPLRRRPVAARELLDAAALRFTERWPNRTLTCTASSDEQLIDGDPIWLRRALDNLVDNARKYSADHAAIAVHAGAVALRGAPAVRIEVIDHGVGISRDDQPRVFTAFFRADRSRTRTTGGVGLGLVLARRIVEAHGGEIGFESEPGAGSRFWFVVPCAAG
jgi:two-component system, OmpR family, sensor kinase